MLQSLIRGYLFAKAAVSRLLALRVRGYVPSFQTPEALAQHMDERFEYVADPLGGVADYYTHPALLASRSAVSPWSCDCDDYAVFAYAALHRMPGYHPRVYTLVEFGIHWVPQWRRFYNFSHVVCSFRGPDGALRVIDTNGLADLGVVQPWQEGPALMEYFGRIYGVKYALAVDTPYPFSI